MSAVGTADADAPPASAKVNPAAPNTGTVAAAVASSVQFTGAFAQAATGTTHVDVGGTTVYDLSAHK